jgi:phosphoribosyl 1,2-cyclic phosphate phosphodiesterase
MRVKPGLEFTYQLLFSLKITFLGTGTSQGIPVIACPCEVCQSADPRDSRLRSSLLVEVNDTAIVIDSGPDFRQQMLRAGLKNLDAILLTHEHKDHLAGMDDIRAFNFIRQQPMDIYAEKRVLKAVKREFAYVFAPARYPGIPRMNLHAIREKPFMVRGIEIIPIRVFHYHLPIFGFRIKDFTYITDANEIGPESMEKLKGTKYLIVNALRKQKHLSHFNLEEAEKLIDTISPEQAYITHISHQFGLYHELEKEMPDRITLAYDTLSFEC